MLVVLLTWIYYGIVLFLIGLGCLKVFASLIKTEIKIEITKNIIVGIAISTVYAQIFSLFYKVGMIAHILLVLVAVGIFIYYRKDAILYLERVKQYVCSWNFIYALVTIIIIAFFTSRGNFHTDTMLYHAQAIQWLEEYGVVPGLANLQHHFGYNSSYFALVALFSMKFLTGISLHTMTGFIACVLCIWSYGKVVEGYRKKRYVTGMCGMAIWFYTFINLTGMMSPASDYVTNLVILHLIARWAEEWEHGNKSVDNYGIICLGCVYLFTLKVSGGLLVLMTVYPAILLIQKKEWKKIGIYLITGIIILLPFLVRNVIISGYLLYPFEAIDVFSFDWKLPLVHVVHDSNQIKVWGRCLFDVALIDMPLKEWFPIWWEYQERYHQMFLGGMVVTLGVLVIICVRKICYKVQMEWEFIVLLLGIIAGMGLWFFMAPFIRYGLAFLLAFSAVVVGEALRKSEHRYGIYKPIITCMLLGLFVCYTPLVDQYVKDAGVFVKQRVMEPYYVVPKQYDVAELKEFEVDGVTFYTVFEGDQLGYAPLPATSYEVMMQGSTLRGTGLEDGFRASEE